MSSDAQEQQQPSQTAAAIKRKQGGALQVSPLASDVVAPPGASSWAGWFFFWKSWLGDLRVERKAYRMEPFE